MKALNRPERTVTGDHKPHKIAPKILPRDMWGYHLPVLGMKPAQDEQVVMWTDGAVHYSGYDADTNDGLRNGSLSGRVDMRSNYCRYALLSDWLDAGNEMPATVTTTTTATASAPATSITTWDSLAADGYSLSSSFSWGQEFYMPSIDGIELLDKRTSNKETAIQACLNHKLGL